MPTQPFVESLLSDTQRQHPNLAPGVSVPPARRTMRERPGVAAARQYERSALGGDHTPNAGFAFTLAQRASAGWTLSPLEHRADAVAVVGECAIRRARKFHRAPSKNDVEFAAELFGYQRSLGDAFEWRPAVTAGASHHYQHRRFVVDCIPEALLMLHAEDLAAHTDRLRHAFGGLLSTNAHG